MDENKVNSLMKDMVEDSPLFGSNKNFTDHSARKTLTKKLNKTIQKSDIISITVHNNERGLDTNDTGEEQQHQYLPIVFRTFNIKH